MLKIHAPLIAGYILTAGLLMPTAMVFAQNAAKQSPNSLSPADRDAVIERLATALTDLIPGDYADDSQQQQAAESVASGFMIGDEAVINESLIELAKLDANVPPRELLLAGMAYAANNPIVGKTLLERAAVLHRRNPGVALAFARLATLQGRFFDAIACVEKAQAANANSDADDDVKTHYRAQCLDVLTAVELRRNELAPAQRYAEQWEALEPNSDKMLLANGEVRFLQDKLQEAISFLQRRSENQKSATPTEVIVAKWYQGQNDDENYSKWISTAYKKRPNHAMTQLEYAAWLVRTEKFSDAKQVIAALAKDSAANSQAKMIQGRILFAEKKFAAAEQLFEELYQQQPGNFEYVYFLTLSLLESGDAAKVRKAAQIARRGFRAFPNNQLSAAVTGWALYSAGDKESGRGLIRRAQQLGPLMADTAYFMAQMLIDDGRNADAKSTLEPFVATPNVFVFRSQSKKLLESIGSANSLPTPTDK